MFVRDDRDEGRVQAISNLLHVRPTADYILFFVCRYYTYNLIL